MHGGGPQATALQKQLGIEPRQIAGRRVTDAATLDVMKMVVAGKLNVDLCAALLRGRAVGGRPPRRLRAGDRGEAAARASTPAPGPIPSTSASSATSSASTSASSRLWAAGGTPVLACLGADARGGVYNINADIVGNQLAAALKAERLLLVTSAPGVLRDIDDPTSRLPRLTIAEASAAIADGTVTGGMIPKLEEAIAVLDQGVGAIHILGKLGAGDLVRAVREPGSVGTTLVP